MEATATRYFPVWIGNRQLRLLDADIDREKKLVRLNHNWYRLICYHDPKGCREFNDGERCTYREKPEGPTTEKPRGYAFRGNVPFALLDLIGVGYFKEDGGEVCEDKPDPKLETIWKCGVAYFYKV